MKKVNTRTTIDGSLEVFDDQPIDLGGFQLRTRSAVALGRPKLEQWLNAMRFAHATADSAPYWWGDLMRYSESRADWQDRISQAMETTGLARQTLLNYTSICNRVEEPERRLAPSPAHAGVVAKLDRQEQAEWLERAADEGWGVRDLQREMHAAKRRRVLKGQADLHGQYRVLYAAPPWSKVRIEELVKMPVEALALSSAVLFLWIPAPLLLADPGPLDVIKAWGFRYVTGGVWDRVTGAFGSYLEITHEHLAICTRGDCQPDRPTPAPKSIYRERRVMDFVNKPKGIRRDWIERLYTKGPYLELFGAEKVDGWTVFGDDPKQWVTGGGR